MTIPIHPVVFILAIFCLMIAIFSIGYAIGKNVEETKFIRNMYIIAVTDTNKNKTILDVTEKDYTPEQHHALTHVDLVQLEVEARNKKNENNML